MDISATQYSEGSESGWTHYLDQSSFSKSYFQIEGTRIMEEEEEEESEEDLSMVSDASSGPPHYDNEYYYENLYSCHSSKSKESQKKKKVKEYGKSQQQNSPLDDTASSPFFSTSKETHKKEDSLSGNGGMESALDFSECVSATTIKKKNKFKKHFSFFEHSFTGKLASEKQDK